MKANIFARNDNKLVVSEPVDMTQEQIIELINDQNEARKFHKENNIKIDKDSPVLACFSK